MSMKYAFVGFGDLGKQFFNLINPSNSDEVIYFDDNLEIDFIKTFPFNFYEDNCFDEFSFVVSLGYKHLEIKNRIINNLTINKRNIHTCIHNSAHVCKTATIGNGVMIYPLACIDFQVHIDDGVLINNNVVISHESKIGRCTYISPGVILSGKVTIGENCFVGSGSIISNDVSIGENVFIGIGSVVTRNINDNAYVIGNPLRKLDKKFNLK